MEIQFRQRLAFELANRFIIASLWVLLIIFCDACHESREQYVTKLNRRDSILRDYYQYSLFAHYMAGRNETVVDVITKFDTIRVNNEFTLLRYNQDSSALNKLVTVKPKNYLIVTETKKGICKINIYDDKSDLVDVAYYPFRQLIKITNPEIEKQKAAFYDYEEKVLKDAKELISKRYNVSQDSLDILLYDEFSTIEEKVNQERDARKSGH